MARVQTVVVSSSDCYEQESHGGISQAEYERLLELIKERAERNHTHPEYALREEVYTKDDYISNEEIDLILSKL